MRICIIGHSLVALRQQLFLKELSKRCNILAIGPSKWNNHNSLDQIGEYYTYLGFDVKNDFSDYYFPDATFKKVEEFEPDLIYSITELYQKQADLSFLWANLLQVPIVFFTWDNINFPPYNENINLMICGNKEAQQKCKQMGYKTDLCVFPGLDHTLFTNKDTEKTHMLVFVGRWNNEKGYYYTNDLSMKFSINLPKNESYLNMPLIYNSAMIQIVPSFETKHWKEQMPACIAEGLLCEVPCVAFDSGSMNSVYEGCPGVIFVPQGDINGMKRQIMKLLDNDNERDKIGKSGREWIIDHYSNEAVAKKTTEIMEKCLKK